jgi:hypothetical protein
MMPKYVKRPVEVEAVQWTGKNKEEILKFCTKGYLQYSNEKLEAELKIQTLEGLMTATTGDYIIKGIIGEFCPCRESIFLETYNKVV